MTMRRMFFSDFWFFFWLVFAGIGIYTILPLRQSLNLGSDLVGGTYLTLEVHTQEAVDAKLAGIMNSLDAKLKKSGKELPTEKNVKNGVILLTFATTQLAQDAATKIKEEESFLEQKVDGNIIHLAFSENKAKEIKKEAVESNINVLRTRLNQYSVAEIPIIAQGENNIVVELPDEKNVQQAKARIGTAAKLEFRLVDKYSPSKDDILYEYDGELPGDKEILPGKNAQEGYYLVNKYADVNGSMLKDAYHKSAGITGMEPVVAFAFNEEGAERFYNLTSKNHGRSLAIVLDNVVISAPRINEPIKGEGQISGNFKPEDTRELATLLKSGSFVATVSFAEDRQIGPALGEQARKDGIMSCLVGLGLLFIFSVAYYSLSGFFAFLALLYNMVLILVWLSWLKATLTLPGIGGMVLTVGMAIDASILIFERIKEELSRGHAIKKSVSLGFSDAMVVILDANITTFIVGAVLYYFGTGPIQGFAVTMMLGVIATLVSGLFFLRSLFMFVLNNFTVQKLKI
ncbi:MAG: protein translocase subunit SecD [Candidatus Dependentiae bacterium]|nr:protein translocase subunit SecD [Candidatus Dependentiae bacterium]